MAEHEKWHLGDDGEIIYDQGQAGERKSKRDEISSYQLLQFLDQLASLKDNYAKLRSRSRYDDLSDIHGADAQALITRIHAAIERISGQKSVYSRHTKTVLSRGEWDGQKLPALMGIVELMRSDLASGYFDAFEEIIRSDIYADFFEMTRQFLNEDRKDAAAVLAGAVISEHLQKLGSRHNITVENSPESLSLSAQMIKLNNKLAEHDIYSKLDQTNVATWLDLWAKAITGQYADYAKEQVSLMTQGIRDFLSRYPA